MTKTIQVRVDDHLKESADSLFTSLGLDTSTAIRMFLVAAMETGGIPFAIIHDYDKDLEIRNAISQRKAGERFHTADEFIEHINTAIMEGANDAKANI